jgi:hypothetical protein
MNIQNNDLIDRRVSFTGIDGKEHFGDVIAENIHILTVGVSDRLRVIVVKDDAGDCWGLAASHVTVLNPNYYPDIDDPALCDHCGHPCHSDDAVTDGNIALCGSFRGNGCADRAMWRGDLIVGIDGNEW